MKRIKFSGILFLLILGICIPCAGQQVQVERRSKLPFAYKEFKNARINQSFGRHTTAKVNFRLSDGALCFLDDQDNIRRAYVNNILSVVVDSVTYMKVDTIFGKVVATQGLNRLICVTLIDKKARDAEIRNIDEMMQNGGGFFKTSILELEEQANEGYPLKDYYYYYLKGKVIPARESFVKKAVAPLYSTAFKSKMGDKMWSWHDPNCLAELLMFFPQ